MAIGTAIGTASLFLWFLLFLRTRRRGRATAKTSAEQQAEVAVVVNRASPTKKNSCTGMVDCTRRFAAGQGGKMMNSTTKRENNS